MLTEIEDKLAEVLRRKLTDIPKENIAVNVELSKVPAVIISNLKFKFEKAEFAENSDSGEVELEEKFSGNGTENVFKLKEEPLKNSVRVEFPIGTVLTEKEDYTIDYAEGSIKLRKAPEKGKNNLLFRYSSKKRVLTLKTIKVKALYSIDALGGNRMEADSLAEKVVRALLEAEDELVGEGIENRPIGGATLAEEKSAKVRLNYVMSRVMRVEQVIGPMEKIEIGKQNHLSP
jgi:hypothetical protein